MTETVCETVVVDIDDLRSQVFMLGARVEALESQLKAISDQTTGLAAQIAAQWSGDAFEKAYVDARRRARADEGDESVMDLLRRAAAVRDGELSDPAGQP